MASNDAEEQIRRLQARRKEKGQLVGLASSGGFDQDIYGTSKPEVNEIRAVEDEAETSSRDFTMAKVRASTLAEQFKNDMVDPERAGDPIAAMRESHGSGLVDTRISNREDEYKQQRMNYMISPDRGGDAFSGKTPVRSYKDIMMERNLEAEKSKVLRKIAEKQEEEKAKGGAKPKKRRRWDDTTGADVKKKKSGWDATPGRFEATPGRFEATPGRFEATP